MANPSDAQSQYGQQHADELLKLVGGAQFYGGENGKFAEFDHFDRNNKQNALSLFSPMLASAGTAFSMNPMMGVMAEKAPGFASQFEGQQFDPMQLIEAIMGKFTTASGEAADPGAAGWTGGETVAQNTDDGTTITTTTNNNKPPPPPPPPKTSNGWDDVRTNSDAIAWALERGDITESEAEWLMRWSNESNHRPGMFAVGSGGIQDWDIAQSDLTPENKRIVSKLVNSLSPNWNKPGTDEFRADLARADNPPGTESPVNPQQTRSYPGTGAINAPGQLGVPTPPPGSQFMGQPPMAPPPPRGQQQPQQLTAPQQPQPPQQPPQPPQQPPQMGMVNPMQQPYMGRGFYGRV